MTLEAKAEAARKLKDYRERLKKQRDMVFHEETTV